MNRNEKTTEIFRNAPVPKAVISNVVPSIISMIMVLVYNLADTVFIGQTHNDLMVADVITQGQTDPINGNTVKPVFRHTLTKVQFNFNTDKNTVAAHPVYVQSITTSELKNVGTLTLPVPSEEVTSPWSGSTGEIKYTDDNPLSLEEFSKARLLFKVLEAG